MGRSDKDEANATTLADVSGGARPSADEAESALAAGDTLGRYLLVERLGAGAMGVVWVAKDPRLDRKIAIKVVHPRLARAPEASARLLREARAMAKVSHNAVVTVHDAGEVDGRLYIAMELVEGTTLGQLLRTRTPEQAGDWKRWLELVLEAGRGLAAAHRGGVLHRDFKPDNVLVDRDGRACVADFGLASLGNDTESDVHSPRDSIPLDLTRTGTVLGTPVYMSPQQLRGEAIDERADQFAFCVTAWEALYGVRPFPVEQRGLAGIAELAATIESSSITLPPSTSPVPPRIRDALMRGLSADAAARWPNIDALVQALEDARVSARPRRARTSWRRARRWWPAAAVGAVVVAGGAGWLAWRSARSAPTTASAVSSTSLAPAKKLFAVSLRSRVALSRDGKRLALGGARIEVRDVDGTGYWSAALSDPVELSAVEIDDDVVYFGHVNTGGMWTWHYRTDRAPQPPTTGLPGFWRGRSSLGDVVTVPGDHPSVKIVSGGRELRSWEVSRLVENLQVSPNGKRVAYLDGGRFDQRLVIRDLDGGHDLSLGPSSAFTALAWRDDTTLVYATGTVDRPKIFQVTVGPTAVGSPTVVHELDAGWIGTLTATRDKLMYIEMGLSSRTRVIERPTLATRDYDGAAVAAPLAWLGPDELLAWNRSSHYVERRSIDNPIGATAVRLATEPANATMAGDTLITSLRGNDGRTTVAYSLSTGAQLWQHADGKTFAVRCAGDRTAPCFAIRIANDKDRIQRIDPQTGALGEVVFEGDRLEDVAVTDDGNRLASCTTSSPTITYVDAASLQATPVSTRPATSVRSVAFDRASGVLVAGTFSRNTYLAGHIAPDGAFKPLVQTENDMLSMIRPSPDAARVLLLTRSYAPSLWQVQ